VGLPSRRSRCCGLTELRSSPRRAAGWLAGWPVQLSSPQFTLCAQVGEVSGQGAGKLGEEVCTVRAAGANELLLVSEQKRPPY
jgi:hypothetical protein